MDVKLIYPMTLVLGLTACGSSETEIMRNEAGGPTNTLANLLANGTTVDIASTPAAFLFRDTFGNMVSVEPTTEVDIAIEPALAGGHQVRVSAFGHTALLSSTSLDADGTGYALPLSDGRTTIYLVSLEATWAEVLSGASAQKFAFTYALTDDDSITGINNRSYGVAGLRTPTSELNELPSATYDARLVGDSFWTDDANSGSRYLADMALSADFANNSVVGRIDNVTFDDDPDTTEFIVNSGTISDGEFSTSLSVDTGTCAPCITLDASKLNGAFYGNAAQEVGGSFDMQGQSAGRDWVIGGAYTGG